MEQWTCGAMNYRALGAWGNGRMGQSVHERILHEEVGNGHVKELPMRK